MPTVTEKIALAREARDEADAKFHKALEDGRKHGMSWAQLGAVAGMSRYTVRYHVEKLNDRRVEAKKGEKTNGAK